MAERPRNEKSFCGRFFVTVKSPTKKQSTGYHQGIRRTNQNMSASGLMPKNSSAASAIAS